MPMVRIVPRGYTGNTPSIPPVASFQAVMTCMYVYASVIQVCYQVLPFGSLTPWHDLSLKESTQHEPNDRYSDAE